MTAQLTFSGKKTILASNLQKLFRDQNNRNDISIRLQLLISCMQKNSEYFLEVGFQGFKRLRVRMESIYTQLQKHRICNWIIHIKIKKYLQAMKQRRALLNLFYYTYGKVLEQNTLSAVYKYEYFELTVVTLENSKNCSQIFLLCILIWSLWWKQFLL